MKKRLLLLVLLVVSLTGAAFLFWPAPTEIDIPAATPTEPDTLSEPRAEATPAPVNNPSPEPEAGDMPASASSSLTRQARDTWYNGNIVEAMSLYQRAIEADPDDPAPYTGYGRLLTLAVNYEQALPLLERARDLQPGKAQPWLDLATLYERSQRFDESFAAQAEAAKIVGAEAITRDEQGRFIVVGETLW